MTSARRRALIARGLTAVRVMPDYMADAVWGEGSAEVVGALRLDDLDLSDGLTERFRAWQAEWEAAARAAHQGAWKPSASDVEAWIAHGRQLSTELQEELGEEIRVRYTPGGDRPGRS